MARTSASARTTRRVAPPLEHRILMTATLCLLAYGAVMVYSASSPQGAIVGGGYGTGEFLMYLFAAAIGLVLMRGLERYGLKLLSERVVRLFLLVSFVLLLAVLLPGIGRSDGTGIRRWLGSGSIEIQPSELMKLALVLYVARYLADNPRRMQRSFKEAVAPVAIVVAPACLLIAAEPDLGTTLVAFFSIVALLIVGGMPMRYVGMIVGGAFIAGCLFVMAEPYQRARLLSFMHPFASEANGGYQAAQGQIAIGSGGVFGDGLGKSVQKLFWLPEAQTDFILAVVGEELGVLGIVGLVALYGMIAYAGLRTARRAATRHTKLLASGLTSLILCQAIVNIFVVLGIAPLTGVPLPFISYAPTNLLVMLSSVGLLMGIARPAARELKLVDRRPRRRAAAVASQASGGVYADTTGLDRGRGNGRPRGSGAGRRGRATG
jgi:cell division protein FtsW